MTCHCIYGIYWYRAFPQTTNRISRANRKQMIGLCNMFSATCRQDTDEKYSALCAALPRVNSRTYKDGCLLCHRLPTAQIRQIPKHLSKKEHPPSKAKHSFGRIWFIQYSKFEKISRVTVLAHLWPVALRSLLLQEVWTHRRPRWARRGREEESPSTGGKVEICVASGWLMGRELWLLQLCDGGEGAGAAVVV